MAMDATRGSLALAEKLRARIKREGIPAGAYLPSERVLIKEHGLSFKTVRRALKLLEAEALIVAEDRRGYRVLSRANDPAKGCPLAFVVGKPPNEGADWFYHRILGELQQAAGRLNWSLLGVFRNGRTPGEIVAHLEAARACGVIVDGMEPELLEQIERMGIPTVMIDSWLESMRLDAIVQDGFTGAMLATGYLASRGHTRVAYFGHPLAAATPQVIERYGGAQCGLARYGLALAPELCVESPWLDPGEGLARARELLSRQNRPTAVFAPWRGPAVAQAAQELGLVLGRDLDLVGWSTEEDYANRFEPRFPAGQTPPAVVWSVATLAELCITRLMQRRADPRLPATVTRIPMRLKLR